MFPVTLSRTTPEKLRILLLGFLSVTIFSFPLLQSPTLASSLTAYTLPRTFQFFAFSGLTSFVLLLLLIIKSITKEKLLYPPLFSFLLLWLLVKTISLLRSASLLDGWWGGYATWADGFYFLLLSILLYLTAYNLAPRKHEQSFFLYLLTAQATVLSLQTITEAIPLGLFLKPARPHTPLYNSDYFIAYALLIGPLLIYLTIKNWKKKRPALKFIQLLQLVLFAVAFFTCLPQSLQGKLFSSPSSPAPGFFRSSDNQERFLEWRIGWQVGKENLLWGAGPGQFTQAFYGKLKDFPNWNPNTYTNHPHNETIEQFAETGVPGTLIYLFFWIFLFKAGVEQVKKETQPYRYLTASFLTGLFLYWLFSQFLFSVVFPGLLVWIILAFLVQTDQTQPAPKPYFSGGYANPLFLWIILGIALVPANFWLYRHLQAEFLYNRARHAGQSWQFAEAVKLSEAAIKAYPFNPLYYNAKFNYLSLKNEGKLGSFYKSNHKEIKQAACAAAQLEQTNPLYLLNCGLSILNMPASVLNQEPIAWQYIQAALSASPNNPKLYQAATKAYRDYDNPTAATIRLDAIKNRAPSNLKIAM